MFEFKASLVSESSTTKTTQKNLVSKTNKQKTDKKELELIILFCVYRYFTCIDVQYMCVMTSRS